MSIPSQKSPLHLRHQHPFYRTYIDMQCRKDILVQNQHVNKKIKAQITPFFEKAFKKAKQNKFRLIYFFSFVFIFKLQPVYDYLLCQNKGVHWVYNNIINYYTDCTKPVSQSIVDLRRERRLVQRSETNKKLAELFYKVDKKPCNVIGFNVENDSFVNDPRWEISLGKFLEICQRKYGNDFSEVELKVKNVFMDSLL